MDFAVLDALRPEFDRFVRRFDACIRSQPTRSHFRSYVRGQLSDLPRKNIVPIAKQAGVPARTLQEFLSQHRWDDRRVRDELQKIIAQRERAADAVGIVDTARHVKRGDKTPGVHAIRCPATGDVENCVVTVHLAYAAGEFRALLDSDVYLPRRGWYENPTRLRAAGVPTGLPYRPASKIALVLIGGAVTRGVPMEWVHAGPDFGESFSFRRGLAKLGVRYMVEVPPDLLGWLPSRLAEPEPREVSKLWLRGGPAWKTHGDVDVRAVRFRVAERNVGGREQWLLIVRRPPEEQERYFLSTAPPETPVAKLVEIAHARRHSEGLLRAARDEVGLDHYDGRRHTGLRRHLVLTAVSLLFLAEQMKLGAAGEP